MSLYGSARHLELAGNLGIVTALQEQFDNLLFSRPKPNGLLRHHLHPWVWIRHCPKNFFAQFGCFHIL